jgi:hypothetical protein
VNCARPGRAGNGHYPYLEKLTSAAREEARLAFLQEGEKYLRGFAWELAYLTQYIQEKGSWQSMLIHADNGKTFDALFPSMHAVTKNIQRDRGKQFKVSLIAEGGGELIDTYSIGRTADAEACQALLWLARHIKQQGRSVLVAPSVFG